MRTHMLIAVAGSLVVAGVAGAQSTPAPMPPAPPLEAVPDYGLTWRTIGSPGNAPALPDQFPRLLDYGEAGRAGFGRVDYTFRLTQTEVTNTQWLEFVQAYASVHPDEAFSIELTGDNIFPVVLDPLNPRYAIIPGEEQAASTMGWFYAARFCNWLHNGKAITVEAFATGAYDMASFVQVGTGALWEGRFQRLPGARFWIPSVHEWTKGMHFDPHRYGPEAPGYWLYPTSSDTPPVPGAPGTPGAQTGAGMYPYPSPWRYFPVGSYPDAQSPWGLLDGSGGEREWVEAMFDRATHSSIPTRGSQAPAPSLSQSAAREDELSEFQFRFPVSSSPGLRLASTIPSSGGLCVFITLGCLISTRRRRSCESVA